ncbi:MAG: 23S rRNA (guanosine(2251)-2'-O)-methyltransferase RlmB [Succinivibrio sp.]|nr:23S rRNA (guanosine(2251)-2'-O)-methyltransferase RlmB [Succinivibrio sp.]
MQLNRKARSNREIVYGINSVSAAIEGEVEKITAAWVVKGREDKRIVELENRLLENGIHVQQALRHFLDEKTEGGVHQGIVIEMQATPPRDEHFLEDLVENATRPLLYVVLDGITDPRNLGACMRSAWAFGACCVIVPKDKSAPFSPVARKTASGAAAVVPLVAVTNLSRTLTMLSDHEVEVVGLAGEAQSEIGAYQFTRSTAVVLGSEESGMRRLTREKCTSIVKIPMAQGVESLNVSVACGVALYEVSKQLGSLQE